MNTSRKKHSARMRSRVPSCRHQRKRVIQYSRDVSDESRSRGVLDTPLSQSMTTSCGARARHTQLVVPAKAGTHNHRLQLLRESRRTASLNTSAAAYGSRLGGRDDVERFRAAPFT